MSLEYVEDRAVRVVGLLRNGGRAIESHDMARLASDLSRSGKAASALEGIIERCNIRWLGDLPLGNIGKVEWLQILNGLENSARAELENLRISSTLHQKTTRSKTRKSFSQAAATRRGENPWAARTESAKQRISLPVISRSNKMQRGTINPTRTSSAGSRRGDLVGKRWSTQGPITRGDSSFLTRLFYFLPPLALLVYSALAVVDAMPDLFSSETVLVEGTFEGNEALTNYSPFGIKGVLYLQGHETPYGIREALGHGFTRITEMLNEGDRVTLQVEANGLPIGGERLEEIVAALRDAETEQEYGVTVRRTVVGGEQNTTPVLEIRSGGEIIYSRLESTPDAQRRIRNWSFLAFGTMFFMFVVRRFAVA